MYVKVIMNIQEGNSNDDMIFTCFRTTIHTTEDDQIKEMVSSGKCICLNSILFSDKKQLLFSQAIARAYEWVPQEFPRWKENKRERRKKENKPERRSVNSRLEFSNNFYTLLTLYTASLRATYRLYYTYIIYNTIILLTIDIFYVSFLFCCCFFLQLHTLFITY